MKSKEDKYIEAVERNLLNAERSKREKYAGKTLQVGKQMIGIKINDDSYDNRVTKLCKPIK